MIAPQVVADVRRLLTEERLSQRKVARLTGVSRSTIAAIVSGKRPDYELLQQLREADWEEPAGPAVRCPGCGHRVYMPCQLCRLRERLAEKRRGTGVASAIQPHRPLAETFEPLGVDLRAEHRARYEEVRAWRIKAEQLALDKPPLAFRSPPAFQGASA
jgi:transcriptional regulator with XRE-family HTH domain